MKYLFILVLIVSSCSTTTTSTCKHLLQVEKEMCLKQVEINQHLLWKTQTTNGYREYGDIK